MSISHLCQSCLNPDKETRACNSCHQTFYCSKTCQENNWGVHKLFCSETKKEVEIERRESCLKTIKIYDTCIFRYILLQRCIRSMCFLLVGVENIEPQTFPLDELHLLNGNGIKLNDHLRIKLFLTVCKVVKIASDYPECKGVPVLYIKDSILSFYILSSKKVAEEIKIVEKMPQPLIKEILSCFSEIKEK